MKTYRVYYAVRTDSAFRKQSSLLVRARNQQEAEQRAKSKVLLDYHYRIFDFKVKKVEMVVAFVG